MRKIMLTDEEVMALGNLLEKLLGHVNYGAGVDAWLGNPDNGNLLLDPDDEANAHLSSVFDKVTQNKGNVGKWAQENSAAMRAHFLDKLVNDVLPDAGFTNIKKVKED